MEEKINLNYLGYHWYEGNNTYLYVYLDDEGKAFYVYTRDNNELKYELGIAVTGSILSLFDEANESMSKTDLQANNNVIDYGYLEK